MSTKLFTLTFVFALLFTQPLTLLADDSKDRQDWNAVKALPVGSKLRVEIKSGEHVEENLSDVSDSTLTLTLKGKTVSFNRTDIRRIYTLKSGSRAKSVLIGTGAGAGIGGGAAAVVLASSGGSDSSSTILATGIFLGAGIGAALGAVLGKGNKRILIYESN